MKPFARRAILALIAADVVVFGGWIGKQEVALRRGVEVRLPVEGFDPRDLISGHYVRFRLVAEREASAFTGGGSGHGEWCVDEDAARSHVVSERASWHPCRVFLGGEHEDRAVHFGVDRFYVDERVAATVRTVHAGEDTYLVARVDQQGTIHPVDLVVDGVSMRQR